VSNKKGSVLIVIIWGLFFLAILALAINSYIWPQMEFSGRLLGDVKMRYLACAGIERAIIETQNDATEDYDSLYDSWGANDGAFKEVPLGAGFFSVIKNPPPLGSGSIYGLTDEESRININKASADVLKTLLVKAAGVGEEDAEGITDSIVDWRDKNDLPGKKGKETSYYEFLGEPYPCKNADFEVSEELLLVAGMTRGIFDKIKEHITIYGDGEVNLNTAGVMALAALGMDESLAEKIVAFREKEQSREEPGDTPANVFTDASQVTDALNKSGGLSGEEISQLTRAATMLGVKSDNFRGTVVGQTAAGGRSKRITFIYNRTDDRVKFWREE